MEGQQQPAKRPKAEGRADLKDFALSEVLKDDAGRSTVLLGRFASQPEGERALVKLAAIAPTAASKPWESMAVALKTESGAEYANYEGTLPTPSTYDVEVICPASERQVTRNTPQPTRFVEETAEDYASKVEPFIASLLSNERSLSWLHNILDGKKVRAVSTLSPASPPTPLSPAGPWH